MLVGFRAPTVDGLSLVVTIGNPEGMFENGEAPLFTEVALLGLEGGGIRSLNFDPVLDTYLLVNEVRNANGVYHPRLWSWSGAPDDVPEEMFLPGLIDLKNVESVNSVTVNGRSRLLITSDDGNVAERRPATYMLLEHDQLWRKARRPETDRGSPAPVRSPDYPPDYPPDRPCPTPRPRRPAARTARAARSRPAGPSAGTPCRDRRRPGRPAAP